MVITVATVTKRQSKLIEQHQYKLPRYIYLLYTYLASLQFSERAQTTHLSDLVDPQSCQVSHISAILLVYSETISGRNEVVILACMTKKP